MKTTYSNWTLCLTGLLLSGMVSMAQPYGHGTISPDFTLPDREGNPVSLYDFAGQVIVLDFFAFWCAPCSVSSPDIEQQIQKHYRDQGGNPDGIPVQVLSINLEAESPESTDAFAERAGLDLVVDDLNQEAWNLYNLLGNQPSIPLFVIINGVTNSTSHSAWEVLHSQHGMYVFPRETTAKAFRSLIDKVKAGPPPISPSPIQNSNPFLGLSTDVAGWKLSPWFGRFNDRHYPWIYHQQLAWQFIRPVGEDSLAFYLYQPAQGWFFTTSADFPQLYDFERNSWILAESRDAGAGPD